MGHISGSLPEGPFRTGGEAGPQVGRRWLKRDTGIRKGLSWSLGVEIWQFIMLWPQVMMYEVGSITNANGLISQQIRNIAKKFKKAATTTFISCVEK
jgi:hypothetical protein